VYKYLSGAISSSVSKITPPFVIIANEKPLPIDFCQGDGFFDAYISSAIIAKYARFKL
jgi:hypothetical protein